ncbi:hypothetical protein MMC25_007151 [Agyrium rufum]|nr:hypothetical protein [Agyrium rufum]
MESETESLVAGLLTQTLVTSSAIRRIIPARIRSATKNDVLFITDYTVEIREYHLDGRLDHVTKKSDFDSKIRSAHVIGLVSPLSLATKDETNEIASGLDAITMQRGRPEKKKFQHKVPPQILVLALESGNLLFLFAVLDESRELRYCTYWRPLSVEASSLGMVGKHIAVDSTSEVMAISTYEGGFSVYSLKSIAEIQAEMEDNGGELIENNLSPIKEEIFYKVPGLILHMDFLFPPTLEPNSPQQPDPTITLLVIIRLKDRKDGKEQTRAHRFVWDPSTSLTQFHEVGTGHLLSDIEQDPCLLIPSRVRCGFIIGCADGSLVVHEDSRHAWDTGKAFSAEAYTKDDGGLSLHDLDDLRERRGNLKQRPVFTTWTRPSTRHDGFRSSGKDQIFLCREDGKAVFLNVASGYQIGQTGIGRLHGDVDTDLASIDNNMDSSISQDLLVIGGNVGNGGVYAFPSRGHFALQQPILCWSPILDLAPIRKSKTLISDATNEFTSEPERLFACTGRGTRHGCVSELRYGLPALSTIQVDLSSCDIEPARVIHTWLFPPTGSRVETLIMLASPSQTDILQLTKGNNDVGEIAAISIPGLAVEETTLAASILSDVILQVTDRSVVIVCQAPKIEDYSLNRTSTHACIVDSMYALLSVVRNGDRHFLLLEILSLNDDNFNLTKVGNAIEVPPVATLSCQIVDSVLLVFVSTLARSLQLFVGNATRGLHLEFECVFDGDFAICDSIALVTPTLRPESLILLCGMRDGRLHVFDLMVGNNEGTQMILKETLSIGVTAVKLVADQTTTDLQSGRPTRAVVHCDDKLYRFHYLSNQQSTSHAHLTRIWVVDNLEPGFLPGSIRAYAQAQSDGIPIDPAYQLCIDNTHLFLIKLELDAEAKMLPRQIPIGGTPSRIMYSSHLQKFVIGFSKALTINAGRREFPMLLVLDPSHVPTSTISVDPFNDTSKVILDLPPARNIGFAGERILGMHEWYPLIADGSTYHFIIVHTLQKRKDNHPTTGRIIFFKLVSGTADADGQAALKEAKVIKTDQPVYSLFAFREYFIFCKGTSIVLYRLSVSPDSSPRTEELSQYNLQSPGTAISVRDDLVYVSTQHHSLCILRMRNDRLQPYSSDVQARSTLAHLVLPGSSLTLITDANCNVTGLRPWRHSRSDNSMQTVFTARLPNMITRLQRIRSRPFWNPDPISSTSATKHKQKHKHISKQDKDKPSHPTNRTPPTEPILGTTLDGTIHQLSILSQPHWILLRFIQNLASCDPLICPYPVSPTSLRDRAHILPSADPLGVVNARRSRAAVLQEKHVDGDILQRVLERARPTVEVYLKVRLELGADDADNDVDGEGGVSDGGDGVGIMEEDEDGDGDNSRRNRGQRQGWRRTGMRDFDSPEERKARFLEVAREALGLSGADGDGDGDGDDDEGDDDDDEDDANWEEAVLERVVGFMREVLRPAL